ncbi:MAG: hypothetical protein WCT50_04230 [Patescibacteria group bacterium]
MKKVIAKKKKTVSKPIISHNKKSLLVEYDLFFGSLVVFCSLLLFSLIFIIFIKGLMSLYLIRENNFSQKIKNNISAVSFVSSDISSELSLPLSNNEGAEVLTEETIVSTSPLSWQESELLTLPEGISSMSNLNFLNSPDGSQFAYILDTEGKSAVSLNGEIGNYYDKILFMVFSPNSRHFAYGVQVDSKEAVVVDGKIGQLSDFIFPPYFFTPDSAHFVYQARTDAGDSLIFDDQAGNAYDQIYDQFMSNDGKTLIYYAKKGNTIYKNTLVLNSN